MQILMEKENEVYLRLSCEPGVKMELNHYFRFHPKDYQFMPMFRRRKWDGYVYLYNINNGKIYYGLKNRIQRFASDREYELIDKTNDLIEHISNEDYLKFLTSFPCEYKLRDYQNAAIRHSIDNRRCVLLSPTASGKSLIIYYLVRYYFPRKSLIIVPTLSLVSQMYSDFESYANKGFEVEKFVHKIFGGQKKETEKPIIISTWQSLYELKTDFFTDFELVIGDEAHLYKAKSLTKIMKNLENAPYRIGTTGTLDDVEVHKLILEGLFGTTKKVTTTKELIKKKTLSTIAIRCLVLKYSKEAAAKISKSNYQEEINFLVQAHEDLSKIEEMKSFDDVEAQKEYWNQKLLEEFNLSVLLSNPLNPDLVKTILALDDASPVKHHVVNILEQTRKSMIEKKKSLIGKNKEKLPVKNTESNFEPTV